VIQSHPHKVVCPTIEKRFFLADKGHAFAKIRILHENGQILAYRKRRRNPSYAQHGKWAAALMSINWKYANGTLQFGKK
jgi:hypothetical protein